MSQVYLMKIHGPDDHKELELLCLWVGHQGLCSRDNLDYGDIGGSYGELKSNGYCWNAQYHHGHRTHNNLDCGDIGGSYGELASNGYCWNAHYHHGRHSWGDLDYGHVDGFYTDQILDGCYNYY